MARKSTEKFKKVDKLERAQKTLKKRESARNEAIEKGEKVKTPYLTSQRNYAASQNLKIQDEKLSYIHPLVIAMNGEQTPVVDPNGIFAFKTPPLLMSDRDLVAHTKAKSTPSVLAVIDFETWQLLAGVLHHAVSLRFNDDGVLLNEENRKDVKFHRSFDEIDEFFCGLMVELINKCHADPSASKEGKVYAHNGSNFDFVGFALHVGTDRNTDVKRRKVIIAKDENGQNKEYPVKYEVASFSGKGRLVISVGKGRKFKILLIDSYHLLPVSVAALGDKGITPEQFTNPISWLSKHEFHVTEADVRPYLYLAHKRALESFEGTHELSDHAYQALQLWKSTLDDPDYSCDDVIILVNAMKRFASKFRAAAQPLANLLGQDAVDSLHPFSYNTSSTAGFALSIAYMYEARLEKDEFGVVKLKKSIAFQQKNKVYALIEAGADYARVLNPEEVQEELESGTVIQNHGVVKHKQRTLIEYPVWTSSIDNRFSRMAQNGSQTTVFKTVASLMKEVDSNSAFPAAMARGCELLVTKRGYEHSGRIIGRYESPIKLNALVGFEDTGYRCSMPTRAMIDSGIATAERMVNEQGIEVTMWVVRGREKILHLLHLRNGEFSVVLPPTTSDVLRRVPGTPIRTPGRGLDSRLVNATFAQPVILVLRGEYIAAYASQPTIDDNAMVVYLCEVGINERGGTAYRDRSRHGPIMGIAMDRDGRIFGTPHMPHKRFVEIIFNTRLEEKKRARRARQAGQQQLAEQLDAEATMTKLILNGGGYGTYAQNKKPEVDFNLELIDECVTIIQGLAGLDPAWRGMYDCITRLAPDLQISEDECTWSDLYLAIRAFRDRKQEVEARELEILHSTVLQLLPDYAVSLDDSTWLDLSAAIKKTNDKTAISVVRRSKIVLNNLRAEQVSAFKKLFITWADNQITSFTSYSHRSNELDENGERKTQLRGIITSAEETASHAIRPYASAIVAKAAINLHIGQLAIERSPFGLAYSDTDSLHAETGIIKPFDNERAIALVQAEHLKVYGAEPTDHVAGLQRLMRDSQVDTDRIFLDILGLYGLKCGEGLGEWGLESHKYAKGLVTPLLDGKPYQSNRTFYLAPKVYVDTDENNNAARTKVRSIPKLNPVHPAVFEGYVTNIPSLTDRRGLDQESFRHVRLDGSHDVKFGTKKRRVPTLFSSPRRIYLDTGNSVPFELKYSDKMVAKILRGDQVPPNVLSIDAMSAIKLDEGLEHIKGLEQAYAQYIAEIKIQGRSFDAVKQDVENEIMARHRLINDQRLVETYNPDIRLVRGRKDIADDDKTYAALEEEFKELEELRAEWDEIAKDMAEREDKNNNKNNEGEV